MGFVFGEVDAAVTNTPTVVIAGSVDTNVTATTSGGLSVSRLVSAASTNATVAKASGGQLYGGYVYNLNAAIRYLKVYNKATTPTVGTDVPFLTIPIPAGGGAALSWLHGIPFSSGISFALTTGVADSDTAAVAASEIIINLLYK